MQPGAKSTFTIAAPSLGWYILLPFILMAVARSMTQSQLSIATVGALAVTVLVSLPARLVIDSSGLHIGWLGRRLDAKWSEVTAVRTSLLRGVWVDLKSGRRLLLIRTFSTRSRATELRDAICKYVESREVND